MTTARTDDPSRSERPPATREAWLQAVRGVILKANPDGTDAEFDEAFARQLVSTTEDGLQIQPLFDSSQSIDVGVPGFAPYVRSTHVAPAPWEVRQRVWPAVEGSSVVGELESGATGVLLELDADTDAAGLRRMLDGVFLELAPISLATPAGDDGTRCGRAARRSVGRRVDRARRTDGERSVSTRSGHGHDRVVRTNWMPVGDASPRS